MGVHFPTWAATEWRKLYAKYFDSAFMSDQSNESIWDAIYKVPDNVIWDTRMVLKKKLTDYIRDKFRETWLKNQGDPSRVVSLLEKINPNALMIGFCRRFATYKRAHLLFTDLDRLAKNCQQSRASCSIPVLRKSPSCRWRRPRSYKEDFRN